MSSLHKFKNVKNLFQSQEKHHRLSIIRYFCVWARFGNNKLQ